MKKAYTTWQKKNKDKKREKSLTRNFFKLSFLDICNLFRLSGFTPPPHPTSTQMLQSAFKNDTVVFKIVLFYNMLI